MREREEVIEHEGREKGYSRMKEESREKCKEIRRKKWRARKKERREGGGGGEKRRGKDREKGLAGCRWV